MTFYQELQLNQAGSKELIRNTQNNKEKFKHIAIYLFKIFLTMIFCMAFVIGYSKIFGNSNSVVYLILNKRKSIFLLINIAKINKINKYI